MRFYNDLFKQHAPSSASELLILHASQISFIKVNDKTKLLLVSLVHQSIPLASFATSSVAARLSCVPAFLKETLQAIAPIHDPIPKIRSLERGQEHKSRAEQPRLDRRDA
ncbi:MAG: hypothetical protein JWO19_3335 [Bryobacterales bacterium]|nr:hypothetical protein [Bryobacterales bacterium]